MEDSILKSVKKILGIAADYTAFDLDILTHINSTFGVLTQLGIGPVDGFMIEDDAATWDSYGVPQNQLNLIRTYVYLKARLLFDPPATSYLITLAEEQIKEYEWRINHSRENDIPFEEVV